MISGGHAVNALPQRATANVNCRIFPGEAPAEVLKTLRGVVNDVAVSVTYKTEPDAYFSPPPPLTPEIMGPINTLAAEFWPGVPVLPILLTAGTDGRFLNKAGVPTYGVQGAFVDPDRGFIHGLNERVGVQSLYEGRDFLDRLVRMYVQ